MYIWCCLLLQREAAAAREELKGARKEALRMRNEGNSLRALYDIANVKAAEQSALAEQRTAALKTQLADAVYTLAEMVPMAELQTAKQEADSARVSCSCYDISNTQICKDRPHQQNTLCRPFFCS